MATKKAVEVSEVKSSESTFLTDEIKSYIASNPKIKELHFTKDGNYYLFAYPEMILEDKRMIPSGKTVVNGGKVEIVQSIKREEILQS